MYSFYTQKGHGFAAVHYARFAERGGILTAPRDLGQTVVTLPKAGEPQKMFLPARTAQDRQLEHITALAKADRLATLADLVDRGRGVLGELLAGEVVLKSETRLVPTTRSVPCTRHMTLSGLVVVAPGELVEDVLAEPPREFADWVATPDEIEALRRLESVTDAYRPVPASDEPLVGFYV